MRKVAEDVNRLKNVIVVSGSMSII